MEQRWLAANPHYHIQPNHTHSSAPQPPKSSLKPLPNPRGSLKNKKCRHSRAGENLV
ncbi:hypothetical protein [Kingella oralis]|uniref:Uncharacterized protein n=1 Tax=Kingella oralis ATCC 51147 TaxID=629741 RepID=C4GJD1_9NEIS|nr:hypothetical protein [Kingella oralis]EEP67903.1 hypothetical protein GCWU000324_02154 [Kingella oralis ATCC 51147]QMT43291.1 hypothetical protein H3L93_02835 [Kingella oralis]